MKRTILIGLLVATSVLVGCGDDTPDETDVAFPTAKPRDIIVTTTPPLTWMARRIVGDSVNVECPVPKKTDPGRWTPDAAAIESLQSAGLIVTNGAGLEKWVVKTTLPTSRLVDTTVGLAEPLIRYENVVVHQHGPDGDQSFEGVDVHTWLDPIIAKHQAARIAEAACREWPQHADTFRTNLKALHGRLDQLDERFRSLQPAMKNVTVVCSHPSYNYVARRYGWNTHNIEIDSNHPIDDELFETVKAVQQPGKTIVVLWRSVPSDETLDQLRKAGLRSVAFETGEATKAVDFPAMMDRNLDQLSAAIEG